MNQGLNSNMMHFHYNLEGSTILGYNHRRPIHPIELHTNSLDGEEETNLSMPKVHIKNPSKKSCMVEEIYKNRFQIKLRRKKYK